MDPLSPGQKVTVQQLVKGKWKKVTTAKLNRKSVVKIKLTPKAKGTYTYRVVAPADRTAATGTSKQAKLKVS